MPPSLPRGRHVVLPDGSSTIVRDFGRPAGPTVILIHGWWVTGDLNWGYNYHRLSERYRVIVADLQGHGRGPRRGERFTMERCVADIIAVADACGVDRFICVGYSLGGAVAQLLAREHPDRTTGTVLCATTDHFAGTGIQRRLFSLLGPISAATRPVRPASRERAFAWGLARRMRGTGLEAWATAQIERGDLQQLLDAGAELYRFDSRSWVGQLGRPVRVLVTTADRTLPTERQREMVRRTGFPVHEVEGDHEVCITHPERFSAVLCDALDTIAGAARGA